VISPPLHALAADGDALPRFTLSRVFTEWDLLSVASLAIVVTALVYLVGVERMRRRGDHWPVGRTLAFVVGGMGSAALATVSGLGVYDDTLLSVHMVQHMILAMIVPLAMALGAPVTLALRTLPRRPR
jgi:cytochrome c oxidase assembly factor CtaG